VSDIDIVCGRYGACCGRYGLWPISFVADMVVADMVCGRYRCVPKKLKSTQLSALVMVIRDRRTKWND